MDQARNFVCRSCQTPVPPGHKFCGRCGAAVPPEILNLRTKYFSDMQAPGKVKLILIKGEGDDGISYQLQATEHVAGRSQGQILFQHDNWLSPRHANFIYRGNKLIVRDEGSLNGVYLRVREGGQVLAGGDTFLCGEQLIRLDPSPRPNDGPDADQTYFYSSPKRPSPFRLTQILRGGGIGMVLCPRESAATIGREGSDMNYPDDPYISASHAKVEADSNGRFTLVDLGSKNGTYVRVKQEAELLHGDYLFLGKQLLRVEIT